ncbi:MULTISPECIES: molybdate ABC transporter substrate-binding protein [unclassified Modestobacter]
MRRALAAATSALVLTGCGAPAEDEDTLTVFAAASLTDVFTELGAQLEDQRPGLTVQFTFAGSSTLATQLTQGAPADVFAPADAEQLARVADAGLAGDPEVYAANRLMLAVPVSNPAGIAPPAAAGIPSLADLLPSDVTLAVCAAEVPCGAAAAEVLEVAGRSDAPDTYDDDVRAVLTKVELGEVDAGLVYRSDVVAAGDRVLAFAFGEAEQVANRYPLATLADAPHPVAAQAFVDLVLSDAGQQALADAGFSVP